jgi:hypothetical protein
VSETAGPTGETHGQASVQDPPLPFEDTADLITCLRGPVTSLVFIASACKRWVDRQEPDLDEVRSLLKLLDNCGNSIVEIIRSAEQEG